MRTNLIPYILSSDNRIKIVQTLLEFPKKQWSCSAVEDSTKLSHATVFRTLTQLRDLNLIKSWRMNRKDILYTVVESPLVKEIENLLDLEIRVAKKIAKEFVEKAKHDIHCAILYGSTVRKNFNSTSDIDILVIPKRKNEHEKRKIYNIAGEISVKVNKTLSILIMYQEEIKKEEKNTFLKSVKSNMEILYGKNPFTTSSALEEGG